MKKKPAVKKPAVKKPAVKKKAAVKKKPAVKTTKAVARKVPPIGMPLERFWAIVDASRARFNPRRGDEKNKTAQERELRALLSSLSAQELLLFEETLQELMGRADRHDLWAAATIIEDGCSDDGFIDFRAWLISMGRQVFESALRDPESLAAVARAPGIEYTRFEGFEGVARALYYERTGEDAEPRLSGEFDVTQGEWWEDGDLPTLMPKLWAKFGTRA